MNYQEKNMKKEEIIRFPGEIREMLFALKDEEYAVFQAKLTPTVPREKFIGVRVPEVRKLAKQLYREGGFEPFLNDLPHQYYDGNMLHGVLISELKDYDQCITEVDKFLPYVDNWAVCDIMSPKNFKKNKTKLIGKIKEWSASDKEYTCRFGLEMLMSHFLDDDFDVSYLKIPASVHSDKYYVKMMIAWFYATALSKQWDYTIPYIEEKRLDEWTHKKTIQKAKESLRITKEQKEYLNTLK